MTSGSPTDNVSSNSDAAAADQAALDMIPITALVLGLASAAFFILLLFYIIAKGCWNSRRQVSATDSNIDHKVLEEGPPTFADLEQLWYPERKPAPVADSNVDRQ